MSAVLDAIKFDVEGVEGHAVVNDKCGGVLGTLLDHFAHAVIVVSPHRKIIHANEAARQELASGDVVYAIAGALKTLSPLDGKVLYRALAKAAGGERSLIKLASSGLVLSLAVLPLKNQDPGQTSFGQIALFFGRDEVCDSGMFEHFVRSNALTPTEEQVLRLLCRNLSTPEIASQLDVAVSTVRSHVRNLCFKTLATGVRDLVAKVTALPPVGRLPKLKLC